MLDEQDDIGAGERIAKFERYMHLLPDVDADPLPQAHWSPLSAAEALDRAKGCLLGLAIGEALGVAVEGQIRGTFAEVTDMTTSDWSDGTAMALCLGRSMIASETVEQYDFMQRLRAWLTQGDNTPQGRAEAVGAITRAAIEEFIQDDQPSAGPVEGDTAGNGSLIRTAPLAIYYAADSDVGRFMASKQSRATHGTLECLDACELFTAQLIDALNGADKAAATQPRMMQLAPNTLAINGGDWKDKSRAEIASAAYVIDTLEAALWAVWNGADFRETVLLAANLGGDPASVAAVAGQLAGALYGASAIPREWLEKLAWRDQIEQLAADLMRPSSAPGSVAPA